MTSPLRERATDRLGVVHEVVGGGWSLLATLCRTRGQWDDRDYAANLEVMTWDEFDPTPNVTCMACMVAKGRT